MPLYNPPAQIQDEGTTQGTVNTFNFTGGGVVASVLGDIATIDIPGSGFALLTEGDFLLNNDPVVTNNYTVTYAGQHVTNETWKDGYSNNIKTIDYTYSGNKVITEVRRIYASDGTTVTNKETVTYSYSGNVLTGYTTVRDVSNVTPEVTIDDFYLDNEPNKIDNTYTNIMSGGKVTQEIWKDYVTTLNLKTIDYTYSANKVNTEVRKIYDTDGTTVLAQGTLTYSYTGSRLNSYTFVRNI